MEIDILRKLAEELRNVIEELESDALELGIPKGVINSCGDSLVCLIGLIKYKYLKNNLDRFNDEVEKVKEEIFKEEQEIVRNLLSFKLDKTVAEIQVILDSLDENGITGR